MAFTWHAHDNDMALIALTWHCDVDIAFTGHLCGSTWRCHGADNVAQHDTDMDCHGIDMALTWH